MKDTQNVDEGVPLDKPNTPISINNKGNVWVVLVTLVVVAGLGVFLFFSQRNPTGTATNDVPTPTAGPTQSVVTTKPTQTVPTPTDIIASPTMIEETNVKYTLNGQTITGEVFPQLELEFPTEPGYEISQNGDLNNELTVKGNGFTMNFSTYTEISPYWGQYSAAPENSTVESQLDGTVYRVKSGEDSFPDYHYTTSFETRDQGGCSAYSNSIQACDGGNIDVNDGNKTTSFIVGCNVDSESNLSSCDQIMSSLKVTIL